MDPVNLVLICLIAFVTVFLLLAVLALAMHLTTMLFPPPAARIDPTVVAAISTTVSTVWPGARLTKIEEES